MKRNSKTKVTRSSFRLPPITPPAHSFPRARSLCSITNQSNSPESAPAALNPANHLSFTAAADSVFSLSPVKSNPRKLALPPIPPGKFLPPTKCYLERKPAKLHQRFTHMNRTLERIPCHDFITALLSGEPYVDDALNHNLKKFVARCQGVPTVHEEDEEL